MRYDAYSEILLKHFHKPVGKGRPEHVNSEAEGRNRVCGDEIRLFLWIDSNGRIREAGFEGKGCMISQASASMLCKVLKDKTRDEAAEMVTSVERMLENGEYKNGLTHDYQALNQVRQYPARIPCARLAWETLRKALKD